MIENYKLKQNLPYDLTRSIEEMTAFFGVKINNDSENIITVEGAKDTCYATYCGPRSECIFSKKIFLSKNIRGEWVRCAKLAILDLLEVVTEKRVNLPWGILTGVRPGKLAHKLLDEGVKEDELVTYLEERYLLPIKQANFLKDICLLQRSLLPNSKKQVGVYIGIPFCPTKCTYCSFPSAIISDDEQTQQNFLNFIEQDMINVVQLISMHKLNVTALYIGGGTPTSLSDTAFARLMKMTSKNLMLPGVNEFTVEAGRPDCFNRNKLLSMEENSVSRISVNPQTLHDKTLKIIGRNHTTADFYNAFRMVRNSSIKTINSDLIIGLPGETEYDVVMSLDGMKALAPDNLTVHTLTLKKNAALFSDYTSHISGEEAERLVEYGRMTAESLSMRPYYMYRQHYMLGNMANVGYATQGKESHYNIQMMEERHTVLGIGPSSATKVPHLDGHHLNKLNMPKNIKTYTEQIDNLVEKRKQLFLKGDE